MTRPLALAVLAVVSTFALGAAACGSTEAKPSLPTGYAVAPAYGYPAALGAAGHFHGFETQSQPSISISGEGAATAPPDAALVRVSVSVQADSAADARDDGKAAINRLLDTVKRFGVEDTDVETRSFNISPVSERDPKTNESRVVGYRLQNSSEVTLRDVDRVGDMLDELVETVGDALRISSITLVIEDPTEVQRQAREKAMLDAQAKAQQLADLTGVRLGPPFSISENFLGEPGGELSKGVLVTPVEEGVAPISVGELEATVSVFAVYSIAQ